MTSPLKELRTTGIILMTEFPHGSPQFWTGWQMNLFGLSIENTLTDPTWDDTLILHARGLAHNAKMFLDA